MRAIRTWTCLALLAACALAAAGCHTTEGFGQDLQSGGRAISDEAREHQR